MSFEAPKTEKNLATATEKEPAVEKKGVESIESPSVLEEKNSVEKDKRKFEFAESLIREITDSEKIVSALKLNEQGKVEGISQPETGDSRVETAKQKEGVIDARSVRGCLVVVYNGNEKIPDGFPDLRSQNRSAEYDPEHETVYVDLSDSWNFLYDKYQPEQLSSFVSHE